MLGQTTATENTVSATTSTNVIQLAPLRNRRCVGADVEPAEVEDQLRRPSLFGHANLPDYGYETGLRQHLVADLEIGQLLSLSCPLLLDGAQEGEVEQEADRRRVGQRQDPDQAPSPPAGEPEGCPARRSRAKASASSRVDISPAACASRSVSIRRPIIGPGESSSSTISSSPSSSFGGDMVSSSRNRFLS